MGLNRRIVLHPITGSNDWQRQDRPGSGSTPDLAIEIDVTSKT